ncbi:MAG TPA: hypothetical protein VHW04_06115 [Solirubrobacteraceae bacterium]|nr:hypothetical protein [Solirubrobacteraceae bacterium]
MAAAAAAFALALGGCGGANRQREPVQRIPAELAREARPIGRGPRFHPPARGPVLGACRRRLGPRDAAHVELFAADRVVLVAAGIGTRPPRRRAEGRIAGARCYGGLVTLDPTGVVLVRRGSPLTIADLFASWGEPLGAHRMASFRARSVTAFVNGRRSRGPVGRIRLRRHAEIVLEVGPHVPPHSAYRFPPGD